MNYLNCKRWKWSKKNEKSITKRWKFSNL